jgi:hypothetical protein
MKEPIFEACRAIEQHCGPEALKLLKLKVPTYTSFF